MDKHVVQYGDTISSIADKYDVSVSRLIKENQIENPDSLIPGQTIVITYPDTVYQVKEGDTLESIATNNGISVMQLYRNNSYLFERRFIYPGETLVINYNYIGKLTTIGYALPFINQTILTKTLPYLTYLFVYNYRLTSEGEIESFYDDTQVIDVSKLYGVAPIMLVTTLSAQGTQDIQGAYEILLNEEIQDKLLEKIILILNAKGYYGFNMTFLYLTEVNEELYNNFTRRVSRRLINEGYMVFVTIDPNLTSTNGELEYAKIDYTVIGNEVNGLSFISYVWGNITRPPSPVTSIENLRVYLDYISTMVSSDKITAGIQIIAYDWELPYVAGFSKINTLSIESAVNLAKDVGAVIQFDEVSQTPYFNYERTEGGYPKQHIVWFIDARTVNSLVNLITQNNYKGPSVWNIMNYYPQLWLIINSQYDIEKVI